MRLFLGAVLLAFAGCSLSPEQYEAIIRNCNDADVDCRPEAVRARVLESFPGIAVKEVVTCATRPTEFCASTDADEDACLVLLTSPIEPATGAATESAAAGPNLARQLLGTGSSAYRLLLRSEIPNKFTGFGGTAPAKVSAYVSEDGTHALLHLAEVRCIDISEIV